MNSFVMSTDWWRQWKKWCDTFAQGRALGKVPPLEFQYQAAEAQSRFVQWLAIELYERARNHREF